MRKASTVIEVIHYKKGDIKYCGNTISIWPKAPPTDDWSLVTCKTCHIVKARRDQKKKKLSVLTV